MNNRLPLILLILLSLAPAQSGCATLYATNGKPARLADKPAERVAGLIAFDAVTLPIQALFLPIGVFSYALESIPKPSLPQPPNAIETPAQ